MSCRQCCIYNNFFNTELVKQFCIESIDFLNLYLEKNQIVLLITNKNEYLEIYVDDDRKIEHLFEFLTFHTPISITLYTTHWQEKVILRNLAIKSKHFYLAADADWDVDELGLKFNGNHINKYFSPRHLINSAPGKICTQCSCDSFIIHAKPCFSLLNLASNEIISQNLKTDELPATLKTFLSKKRFKLTVLFNKLAERKLFFDIF
jgi:hypothetical protein